MKLASAALSGISTGTKVFTAGVISGANETDILRLTPLVAEGILVLFKSVVLFFFMSRAAATVRNKIQPKIQYLVPELSHRNHLSATQKHPKTARTYGRKMLIVSRLFDTSRIWILSNYWQ